MDVVYEYNTITKEFIRTLFLSNIVNVHKLWSVKMSEFVQQLHAIFD